MSPAGRRCVKSGGGWQARCRSRFLSDVATKTTTKSGSTNTATAKLVGMFTADWWIDFRFAYILTLIAVIPRIYPLFNSLWYDEIWSLNFMRLGPVYAISHQ